MTKVKAAKRMSHHQSPRLNPTRMLKKLPHLSLPRARRRSRQLPRMKRARSKMRKTNPSPSLVTKISSNPMKRKSRLLPSPLIAKTPRRAKKRLKPKQKRNQKMRR